jgi:hypothetical protein
MSSSTGQPPPKQLACHNLRSHPKHFHAAASLSTADVTASAPNHHTLIGCFAFPSLCLFGVCHHLSVELTGAFVCRLAFEVERASAAATGPAAAPGYAALRVNRYRSAQGSLEALGALMAPASLFLAPISTMLRHDDVTLRRCAVVLLAAQLQQRQRASRKSSLPLPPSSVSQLIALVADLTPFFNDATAPLKTRQATLHPMGSLRPAPPHLLHLVCSFPIIPCFCIPIYG